VYLLKIMGKMGQLIFMPAAERSARDLDGCKYTAANYIYTFSAINLSFFLSSFPYSKQEGIGAIRGNRPSVVLYMAAASPASNAKAFSPRFGR